MITDIQKLINLCEQELDHREYTLDRRRKISNTWTNLSEWMHRNDYDEFNEQLGFLYCDIFFGWHDLTRPIAKKNRVKLRAVRMLISYQKDGDFEFRTPSIIKEFIDYTGKRICEYLNYLKLEQGLKPATISNKKYYLQLFNEYLELQSFDFVNVTFELIDEFYLLYDLSLAGKHNCNCTLRLFLRYLFDFGFTIDDYSVYIIKDNYRRSKKLPTTYEEGEIKQVIESIERGSAIGKRDYLIILLAAEYGWRSSDIVIFSFEQIDWEKNTISFNQQKTETPVTYPLLSSIGNAIIDYLKYGRPTTNAQEIIVSHDSGNRGKPLCKTTIHSVGTKYMRKANIKHWKKKKHGAHALRHSLAGNMLKKNISMPIISTVLGHQNTESTKVYLAINYHQLKQCTLPMPTITSRYYKGGVLNG